MRFFFRLTAPRCPGKAAGAVSQRKSHDMVISSFCNIVKGQAKYSLIMRDQYWSLFSVKSRYKRLLECLWLGNSPKKFISLSLHIKITYYTVFPFFRAIYVCAVLVIFF